MDAPLEMEGRAMNRISDVDQPVEAVRQITVFLEALQEISVLLEDLGVHGLLQVQEEVLAVLPRKVHRLASDGLLAVPHKVLPYLAPTDVVGVAILGLVQCTPLGVSQRLILELVQQSTLEVGVVGVV